MSWILGRLAVVPFKGFFVVGGTTWRLEILTEIRNSRRNNKFVFVMCGSGGLQSNSLVIQGWEECWEEGAEFGIRLSLDALGAKPLLDKSHWIFSSVCPWIILSIPSPFLAIWPLLHQQLRKLPGI